MRIDDFDPTPPLSVWTPVGPLWPAIKKRTSTRHISPNVIWKREGEKMLLLRLGEIKNSRDRSIHQAHSFIWRERDGTDRTDIRLIFLLCGGEREKKRIGSRQSRKNVEIYIYIRPHQSFSYFSGAPSKNNVDVYIYTALMAQRIWRENISKKRLGREREKKKR